MQQLISELARHLPGGVRKALLGSPSSPARLAKLVHQCLNWLPVERFPVLACGGPLEGYRMKVDWHHHRSFIYGDWEAEVVRALEQVVLPGMLAMDIGAHIGFFTLFLSKLVGPEGRVIAFEPLPENFKILQENISLNRCHHVRAVNKAILDRRGPAEINVPPNDPLPGTVSWLAQEGARPVPVEAISLDEFVEGERLAVDFIKMDVEGTEELVLRGAEEVIATHHPLLLIEVHHWSRDREQHPVKSLLCRWGYQTRWVNRWEHISHLLAS